MQIFDQISCNMGGQDKTVVHCIFNFKAKFFLPKSHFSFPLQPPHNTTILQRSKFHMNPATFLAFCHIWSTNLSLFHIISIKLQKYQLTHKSYIDIKNNYHKVFNIRSHNVDLPKQVIQLSSVLVFLYKYILFMCLDFFAGQKS